jgi:hypothetical protein
VVNDQEMLCVFFPIFTFTDASYFVCGRSGLTGTSPGEG